MDEHYLTAPQIVVRGGSKYLKLVRREQHGDSVYGFVRKEKGAILKAACWSAPFVKGPSAVQVMSPTHHRHGIGHAMGAYAR